MKRRRLSKLQKVRIFDRAHGICHVCKLRIHVGQAWEAEHVIALADGGTDDESNMAPAHKKPCHRAKTGREATDRSKVVRMRANHLGIAGEGAKLPCGRESRQRKTMRGEVIPRVSQSEAHREMMRRWTIGSS